MLNHKILGNYTLTWRCRTVENTLRLMTCVLTMCVYVRVCVFFLPAVTWISRRSGGTPPCITAACTRSPSASSYSWGASRRPISVSHASRFILSLMSSVRTYQTPQLLIIPPLPSANQNGETALDVARRLRNTQCEEAVSTGAPSWWFWTSQWILML